MNKRAYAGGLPPLAWAIIALGAVIIIIVVIMVLSPAFKQNLLELKP